MSEEPKFTHVAIERPTRRKITLLAKIFGVSIYELVGTWAEKDWKEALEAGLVTEAMLESVERVMEGAA